MELIAKVLLWLGRSALGQAFFTLLIEKFGTFIQMSIAREKERRRMEAEKQKLISDLANSKTPEDQQSATSALAKYLSDK